MRIGMVVVTCLILDLQGAAAAQRVGLVNKLYEAYAEVQIAAEVELTPEQADALEELATHFRVDHRDFIRRAMSLSRRPIEDGVVPWKTMQHEIDALNHEIMRKTREVFVSQSRFQRYVQLLTQKYLRESRFEEAAVLHGLEVSASQRAQMLERAAERGRTRPTRLAEESWDVASRGLRAVLDATRLTELCGKIKNLHRFPRSRQDGFEAYDDLPMRLVVYRDVQLELALTANQSRELTSIHQRRLREGKIDELVEDFEERVKDELEPAVIEVAEKQLLKDIDALNQDMLSEVRRVLNEQQWIRFKQLLFQQYVRQLRFERALRLVGEDCDRLDPVKHPNDPVQVALRRNTGEARLHLRYLDQRLRVEDGLEVLRVVSGDQPATQLIGLISLAPEDPFLNDAELRKRLTEEFRMASQTRPEANQHPRRIKCSRIPR